MLQVHQDEDVQATQLVGQVQAIRLHQGGLPQEAAVLLNGVFACKETPRGSPFQWRPFPRDFALKKTTVRMLGKYGSEGVFKRKEAACGSPFGQKLS